MVNNFKILFVDVIDRRIHLQRSYPHLGIGYLVSYLHKNIGNIDVLVINRNHLKQIKSFRPDIIALSSVTQNFTQAKEIAKSAKDCSPLLPVIAGGVHITQLPESMGKSIDIGVVGEGEKTFLELVRHMRDNKDFRNGLDAIDGLAFWRNGQLVRTRQREMILPLDDIPHPDRSVLPSRENQLLLTSRGCPYRCAFCASSFFWKKVRYFSSDYVLEEIERVVRHYPVINLTIYDDLFVFDKKRLSEISAKIVKAGYHKKINFWCLARANHIDEETLGYLKEMNVKGIGMGLESGSNRILKAIKSDNVSVEINRRAIELCKRKGIFVHGSFILGSPNETEEDMLETQDFIKNSDIDKGDISVATPLPGTDFWNYALKEQMVSNDMDWSRLSIRYLEDLPDLQNCLLLTKELSKQRFLEIFRNIASGLIERRKQYDTKWDMVQGKEINLRSFFSLLNFKKFVNDPYRGLRYAANFLLTIPSRLLMSDREKR